MLKYCIQHPKIGSQAIKAAYQTWESSKHRTIEASTTIPIDQAMKNLFPNEQFSLQEFTDNLLCLRNHIQNFNSKLENVDYPSTKKPYPLNYSVDDQTGLLLYSMCKIFKPERVIETGVAYGYSSAHILQALHENKKGKLYSIDFTFRPWETKEMIGSMIPQDLKERWELIFGISSEKLPDLLKSLRSIDLFIHDSLHTFKNMMFEFETAWPYIKKTGFLMSDDIQSNNSFNLFCSLVKLKPIILSQQSSDKSFGILRKIE
jgi:predicted O-methyltransferase YrrM